MTEDIIESVEYWGWYDGPTEGIVYFRDGTVMFYMVDNQEDDHEWQYRGWTVGPDILAELKEIESSLDDISMNSPAGRRYNEFINEHFGGEADTIFPERLLFPDPGE